MWLAQKLFGLKQAIQEYKKKVLDQVGTTTYIVREEKNPEGVDGRAIVFLDPKSHIAEQYRIMRTNLRALSPDKPMHSFAVSSALRGEGKTITSCNISLAFAQEAEKKVLLVDSDLRKPSIHKIFNISREPGLSDLLVGDIEVGSLIAKPKVGGLFIIPAGKMSPNPSELLSSKRLKELIEYLKHEFDYVFFDCPPIIPVTDAGVLGSQLDGTILVVKAASTGALDVERAFSLFKDANANPIGAVLCNVQTYIPYYLYRYRYVYVNKY